MQLYNLIGQPIAWKHWINPNNKLINNNDRTYNVIGQRVVQIPRPPKPEPLMPRSTHSIWNRPANYNVIGQKLAPFQWSQTLGPCDDQRAYNVIGQPVKLPEPRIEIGSYTIWRCCFRMSIELNGFLPV